MVDAKVIDLVPWERARQRHRKLKQAVEQLMKPSQVTGLENAREIVASAGPLEVYFELKRLGLEDSVSVLDALVPEQITTLFDLESWRADVLEVADVLAWLEAFRTAGRSSLRRAARAIDSSALLTLLRRRLWIAHKPKEDRSDDEPLPDWLRHPPPEIEPLMETPDGRFLIAARAEDEDVWQEGEGLVDEEERKQVLQLVRELYLDEDWPFAASLLRAAVDQSTIQLEEEAYRSKNLRLEDFGLLPRERALQVYGLLDPDHLESVESPSYGGIPGVRLPIPFMDALEEGLLSEALRGLPASRVEACESDLLALSNAVLVADSVNPSHEESVVEALRRVRGYLALGLGHGASSAGEQIELAHRRLAKVHPTILFRVGYTLTVRCKSKAEQVQRHSALGGLGVASLSSVEQAVLEAVLQTRPAFPRVLEGESGTRAFASEADLQRLERFFCKTLGVLDGLLELGFPELLTVELKEVLPDQPERDIDHWLTTMAANLVLGRARLEPLDAAGLLDLVDQVGMTATPSFASAQVVAVSLTSAESLQSRIRQVLDRLAHQLFSLVGQSSVNPRFVEGLIRSTR